MTALDNKVSTLLQGTNSNIYETFIIAGTNNVTFSNSGYYTWRFSSGCRRI